MTAGAPCPAGPAAVERLRGLAHADGGYPERPLGAFRPDATALALLALAAAGASEEARRAGARLAAAQREDGSVPLDPRRPGTAWPTALAALAWAGTGTAAAAAARARGFLLASAGRHWTRTAQDPTGNDPALRGWPWSADAHSWAEPTALAVLALKATGDAGHPRVEEGVRMLLDRQVPAGGWNYGNTTVFGRALEPHPDVTGIVLAALARLAPRPRVEPGLGFLAARLPRVRTPRSLAWGILGLAAWGRRPPGADGWVSECLGDDALPAYGAGHLALLALAALRREGLAA